MLSRKLLTIDEVADYLGLLRCTVERELERGKIPHRRVSGEIMFDPADFKNRPGVHCCQYCQYEQTIFCENCEGRKE